MNRAQLREHAERTKIKKAINISKRPPKPRRTRIEKVESILLQALEGENVDQLLKRGLSVEEQELFYQLLGSIRSSDPTIMDDLWRVDYIRRPPTITEFIEDDYWLGSVLRPSQDSKGLFPKWKEILTKDFDLDSRIHNLVFTGSLGIGKCHGKGTGIILYNGQIKKVEDVVVGDLLMGDDSTPRKVLSTTRGHGKMYSIKSLRPKNSKPWTCNEDHILCLRYKDSSIIEISVKDYLANKKKYVGYKLYRKCVKFRSKRVKIDPYWLGLWLGDGASHCAALVISHRDRPKLLAYHKNIAKSYGLKVGIWNKDKNSGCELYSAVNKIKVGGARNALVKDLKSYGLLSKIGSPTNKHIPKAYLFNSVRVRKNILAGIIDSDGGVEGDKSYEVSFSVKRLAVETTYLARSLGYMADFRKSKCSDQNGTVCTRYRIVISGCDSIPVRLARKKLAKRSKNNKRTLGITGFSVRKIKDNDYYGFTLDGNGRYLLEDFTVTHNTYVLCIIFLYKIALCTMLRKPQQFYGLGKGSKIFYVMLSLSKSVVEETVFGDIQNFMANSPYFLEQCNYDPDSKYSNFRIGLGKGVFLTAGSKGWHIIGRNAMGVCLDEGNWRLEANPDQRAYKLYDEIATRIQNRFQKVTGFLPAISILSSSARDESSFTEKVIGDINRAGDETTQKVYRYAVYDIRKDELRLTGKWFRVAHGLKSMDPYIVGGLFDDSKKPIIDPEFPHEDPPSGASIVYVPEYYLPAFKRNCISNLQSICGISTGGSHRLFSSMTDVERCIELSTPDVQNPARMELMPISMEDNKQIWDFLEHPKFLTRRNSLVCPIRHPDAIRYAHVDLATASMAGVAISHLVGQQKVEGIIKNGEVFSEYRMIVEFDFILTIVAGQTKPISIEKIQNFFFWLRDICNYKFGLVTMDQWQSSNSLQMMEARGFTTKNLSMDREKTQYYALRSGFEELRIRMYRQRQALVELENLLDGDKKIDHPANGSKDSSDALGGSYYNAITSEDSVQGTSEPTAMETGQADNADEIEPVSINIPPMNRQTKTFSA